MTGESWSSDTAISKLDSKRGGPVRMVVPEAYGFKSVKWLTHIVLTNLAHANDTYAEQNNDIDSPLKTFAASLSVPLIVEAGQPIQVSGFQTTRTASMPQASRTRGRYV